MNTTQPVPKSMSTGWKPVAGIGDPGTKTIISPSLNPGGRIGTGLGHMTSCNLRLCTATTIHVPATCTKIPLLDHLFATSRCLETVPRTKCKGEPGQKNDTGKVWTNIARHPKRSIDLTNERQAIRTRNAIQKNCRASCHEQSDTCRKTVPMHGTREQCGTGTKA